MYCAKGSVVLYFSAMETGNTDNCKYAHFKHYLCKLSGEIQGFF